MLTKKAFLELAKSEVAKILNCKNDDIYFIWICSTPENGIVLLSSNVDTCKGKSFEFYYDKNSDKHFITEWHKTNEINIGIIHLNTISVNEFFKRAKYAVSNGHNIDPELLCIGSYKYEKNKMTFDVRYRQVLGTDLLDSGHFPVVFMLNNVEVID